MKIDFHAAFEPLLRNWPALLGLLLLALGIRFLTSARFKGWLGEWSVRKALEKLDPSLYQTFHDLYLNRPDGDGTTQVDHVVVSPFGIFVIETKNIRGWIFGSQKQREWTQQIYRHKSRFQNPLHQNHLHIRALMQFLDLPESRFVPIVIFVGDVTFKTEMPDNVLKRGLLDCIGRYNTPILTPPQQQSTKDSLARLEQETDRKAAAKAHVRALRKRAAS